MISTATALIIPWAIAPGRGPRRPGHECAESDERSPRERTIRRPDRPASGSARAPLRLGQRLHDLREHRFRADLAGSMTSAPVTSRLPRRRGPPTFLDRDRLTCDHRLSTDDGPSMTTLSTGTFSPGAPSTGHPLGPDVECTSSSRPSLRMRRAIFGAKSSSARIAPLVLSRARNSSTWPRRTRTVMTAAASKYTATAPRRCGMPQGIFRERESPTTLYTQATPVPDRNEREHIEISSDDGIPSTHEEGPARPQHDRRRQNHLDPVRYRLAQIVTQPCQMRAHFEHNDRKRQNSPDPQPAAHIRKLGIGRGFRRCKHRLQRHAAYRAGARAHLANFRGALGMCRLSQRQSLACSAPRCRDTSAARRRTLRDIRWSRNRKSALRVDTETRRHAGLRPCRTPGPVRLFLGSARRCWHSLKKSPEEEKGVVPDTPYGYRPAISEFAKGNFRWDLRTPVNVIHSAPTRRAVCRA